MRITAAESTDLFTGPETAPRQVIRVTLAGPRPGPARVRIEGPLVRTPDPVLAPAGADEVTVEVGVVFAAPATPGVSYPATVSCGSSTMDVTVTAAETGWTMWLISHFHYDPVWWNTQAGFTDTWLDLPQAQEKRMPFQLSAFDLVRAHLQAARDDADYRFVLAEVDYLKPHWNAFPEDRHDLRRFIRDGKIEIVGGNYNEANTNLTHPESTIRNAEFGIAFQRDVLGADPRSAWMLDVFGHDPAYPGLMADAGLTSSVWARGPWHHVGTKRHTGDITRMQFPSEFEWISPTGRGLLTAYLADHYVAGWDIERVDTLEESMAAAYKQFSSLRRVAATRNVLLPVGHDHNIPSRFATQIHREWNNRYVWPKFVVGLPRDFCAAVRAELDATGSRLSPQTRDMNPVYTGKDVSYIDTKQAQRAAETAVLDAERAATLATLLGANYPKPALDKAWRQLIYGAHHDAITGTESDQVYLDLLTGWREADELGREALSGALTYLGDRVDTTGDGIPVLTVNTLSFLRDAVTTITLTYAEPGTPGARLVSPDGAEVPSVTEAAVHHPDGTLAELTLTFIARQVPALGYRVYRVIPADTTPPGWTGEPGRTTIENETFLVEGQHRVHDKRAGRDLLRPDGKAGELVLQAEHPKHPVWEEGPWHLLPAGPGTPAELADSHAETSPLGSRLVAHTTLFGLTITQHTTLWAGIDRVDYRHFVDGSIGQDNLLRLRFDLDVPGALPVAEVGFAAVGRSFGFPESDAAEHLYTLDSPAHTWAGLSATARIALHHESGKIESHAIGIAEVISADDTRDLLAALVAKGVTATSTKPDGQRYGALDADSNLPDVRIVVGAENSFADSVLDDQTRSALATHGRAFLPATRTRQEQWLPNADLRNPRDLPVLIISADELPAVIDELSAGKITVTVPAGMPGTNEPADDYSVAVINHGTPGFVVDSAGSLWLSLMRSCSGWPCGVWIDGERRTAPDGSSFAWQHWTHTFDFSLVAGEGDWRQAGFMRHGQSINHPLRTQQVTSSAGSLPPEQSLISIDSPTALLTSAQTTKDGRIALRLYETTGNTTDVKVDLFGGINQIHRTNPLNENPKQITKVTLGPADVATIHLTPATPATPTGTHLARTSEPVQPIHTSYWRHNTGPAPIGDLPVSIHLTKDRLVVSNGPTPLTGEVELLIPEGVSVAPVDLTYNLAPDAYAEFPLRIETGSGRHILAARIKDNLGQTLETSLLLGQPEAEILILHLDTDELTLTPGETAELPVSLTNLINSEIHGELTLISPHGTWSGELTAGPRTQPFTLHPGEQTTAKISINAAPTARPGAHWWALVRAGTHGHVYYSPTVSIRIK